VSTIQDVVEKKAFIGFLVGDEGVEDYADALVKGGVNLLEIGLPFSDPVADGPVIQNAAHSAIQNGTTPHKVLERIERIKKRTNVPVVLFSYFNPLLKLGKPFVTEMKKRGCDGVLIVDLPLEEAGEYLAWVHEAGLDSIFVASPSTPLERIEKLSQASSGFLYYACQKGTTGKRDDLPIEIIQRLEAIKEKCPLPVAVGFGISKRKQAADLLKVADGFIVGSAFVEKAFAKCDPKTLTELARSIDPRSP